VLRIADPARVNRRVPHFTRTGFCQKERGVAAECAELVGREASVGVKLIRTAEGARSESNRYVRKHGVQVRRDLRVGLLFRPW